MALSDDELRRAVDDAANLMAGGRKALVFLFCRNDIGSVIAYLAAVAAGHAVALLDASLPGVLRGQLIASYEPEWIVEPGDPGAAKPGIGPTHIFGSQVHRTASEGLPIHHDLAVLLSTSGSTGSPKFVRLSHGNVVANTRSIVRALGITSAERPVTSLPMFYSYGLSVINSHLAAGARLVLTDASIVTRDFWDLVAEHKCSSFAGVPQTYRMLRRIGFQDFPLPALRTMTQAGGKLEAAVVVEFHEHMEARGGRFFVMYGQTEATARIAVLPPDHLPEKAASVGIAVPDGRIEIEVDGRSVDDPGEHGEVVYSGPNVMMGYATGRSELGRGDDLDGVLHTGDIGFLDDDRFLHITGRSARIAKVYGLRFNLDEIEGLLRRHGPVAVIGADDRLVAFCEFDDGGRYQELAKELARALRIHHRAIELRHIPALPLNAHGKVEYARLAEDA
jgi:acyl-CoA synthetase (AMP-forming)/AMP-acid ligase II